jgi:2-desacetyl-2-hydroxyethyl bacteriochlorophyllide A dehydrogenase
MKALVWEGPRQMNVREVPEPDPGPEEVLIKVAYSGICGSELGGYLGENTLRVPPLIMGHEFSGEIAGLGSRASQYNPDLALGQRVTVNPLVHCGWCRACLNGRFNLCRERQIVGIHRPGSFADLVTAPAALVYPLPDQLSLEHAALAEPVGCAIRAVKLADCSPLDRLLITGLGPIGLLTLQVAQTFGASQIYATDTDPDRRAIGQEFGVKVLDPLAEDVVGLIEAETNGEGVEAAIDAVGLAVTRQECIAAVARGGRVIFVGLHDEESTIQSNLVIRNEVSLEGSFAYAPVDFADGFQWLVQGNLQIDPWLVKAPLADGGQCFERLLSQPGPAAKILLHS